MVYMIIFLLVITILFSSFYVYAAHKDRGDAWTVETLFIGSKPSLALDPVTHNPRISYYDGNHLAFARLEDGWSTEIVDEASSGEGSSLAIDQVTGHPKIAYVAYTPELNYHIRYAEWDGARWTIEAVGALEEGHSAADVSLALDPRTQEPRIVYIDQTEASYLEVRYLARNDARWTMEVVGPAAGSSSPSLVMTSAGEPNIAYRSGCHLMFAARHEGAWVTEDVTIVADSGYESSLRLQTDDAPVIAYLSIVPVDLFCFHLMDVARKEDSGWSVERPVSNAIRGICLALEQETGFTCISFYHEVENHLKYVSWDGVAWVEEFVDDTEGIHVLKMKSSLALVPGTNAPRVAYAATDRPRARIRYAWRD